MPPLEIEFKYRNPTPTHCDTEVVVNGAHAGTLHLRQGELALIESILVKGLHHGDHFTSSGNPNPPGWA